MHCKSYSHFFSKKFQHNCVSLDVNFNESLTNDVVSFEQLGPAVQVDVTRAEFWADIWDMFYNKKKCHHLHLGNYTPVGNYTMMEDKKPIEIEKVEYEKDLGIIVDNRLNFREHITSKVNIANRNLGIMFKTFTYMDQEMFLNLYKVWLGHI